MPQTLLILAALLQAVQPQQRDQSPVRRIVVTPASPVIVGRDTLRLRAQALDSAGNVLRGAVIRFSVEGSPPEGTVDADGLVRSTGTGALSITVTATMTGAPPATQRVQVMMAPGPPARVEFVRMPRRLLIGQRVRLAARVLSADGDVRADDWIAWRATSSSYVSLAADGRITGIRPGQVDILAIVDSAMATSGLEVIATEVGAVSITPAYSRARVGDVVWLRLTVVDGDGAPIDGLLAEWSVTPEPATIDDAGAFVAREPGLYTVLATIGDRKAVATVRVAPASAR